MSSVFRLCLYSASIVGNLLAWNYCQVFVMFLYYLLCLLCFVVYYYYYVMNKDEYTRRNSSLYFGSWQTYVS